MPPLHALGVEHAGAMGADGQGDRGFAHATRVPGRHRQGGTTYPLSHTHGSSGCDSSSCPQILCNDCQNHCTAPFHVLGMKCSCCGSYNTAQDGGVMQEEHREAQGQVPQQQGEEEQIDEEEAAS